MRLSDGFFLKHLLGEDQLLNLAGAFINTECADLAIKTLHRMTRYDSHAAKKLYSIIDHALRGFGRKQFCHRSFARDAVGPAVSRPGSAVDEERGGVNG